MKIITTASILLLTSFASQAQSANISGKFDAGGLNLHIECFGSSKAGEPVVILQDGMGGYGSAGDWQAVIQDISTTHQVCQFDRAGLGQSDEVKQPYHVKKATEQLNTLLHNAGVKGPYLMVGHSLASYHVRLFNELYTNQVSGILLVDPSVYGMMHDRATGWRPETECYSEQLTQMMEHSISEWHHPEQTYEKLDYKLGYQQIRTAKDFGDKPYRLLLAKGRDTMKTTPPGGWPKARWDRVLAWFNKGMKQLKSMSSRTQVHFSQTESHAVHYDEPQTVIKHIRGLLVDIKSEGL
jgi:pimeloyl-ACP methyl ester carboxylesterase